MNERNQSKACDLLVMKSDNILQDRIGPLPDELLIHIISYLPLGLAVGTSAISRRWRNLWMKNSSNLRFDAYKVFGQELSYAEQRLKSLQFVRLVDGALEQLASPLISVSSFSGYYELLGDFVSHVDLWVMFSLQKNMRILISGES
ncbi:F-box/FBD/LRR-repeat protein At2g04230-like [Beta vulgaris subsp. vulgaris]|uniref:F-box/FBD/LRR-repeat protein At2g04230-like n=1 Tax=Beta vulgaris subsp. vulgaris TaxID=3555 RepID=UPI002547C6D1|nr:F-box/FBD/LRR-repeat protein At2g04230-like [Beta vulgaris subsp. vulgaris]